MNITPREVIGWAIAAIIVALAIWLVLEVIDEGDEPGYIDLGPMYEEIVG